LHDLKQHPAPSCTGQSTDVFLGHTRQAVYVSATPGPFESANSEQIAEQVIRSTGLLDPEISVHPTAGQIDDVLAETQARIAKGQRVLMTTLTKRMAANLTLCWQRPGLR